MRVTLLGHAAVLVEMDGATVLMDPVFADPFEEGAVVSCPRRSVHPDELPPIDLLVVSHRHPDHFDPPSLARVTRQCDAICPADPLIVHGLRELGFERVHPVHPMGEIAGGTFELFPTRSEVRSIPEFGMVLRDASGTFFNQVDSELAPETIDVVRRRFGQIDVHFAMYASQNFDFFEDRSTAFPLETHRDNLCNACRIGARLVVPASAGFRFVGELAWLNSFVFPISRERFVSDLHQLWPGVNTRLVDPGDVVEIAGGEATYVACASPAATTELDDSALIAFDPTAPIPDLVDGNPEDVPASELAARCRAVVVAPLCEYATRGEDRVTAAYRSAGATYDLEVVLPGGDRLSVRLRFDPAGVQVERPSGTPMTKGVTVSHRITASALLQWVTNTKSFFYVRGWSRRSQVCYRLNDGGGGGRSALPDLLMHYVINVAPGSELAAKFHLDHQLSLLRG